MLCSAHQGTLLVEIGADRLTWTPALQELCERGLIEFYAEAARGEEDEWGITRHAVPRLTTSEAFAELADPAAWSPNDGRLFNMGFGTTEAGERAVDQNAYHYIDGHFIDWRP